MKFGTDVAYLLCHSVPTLIPFSTEFFVCIIIIIIIIIRPIIIIYLFHQFITMPFILILDFPVATCIILPRVPYHRVPLFLDG